MEPAVTLRRGIEVILARPVPLQTVTIQLVELMKASPSFGPELTAGPVFFFHRCFTPSTPVGINEQGVTQRLRRKKMRLGHIS